jgi:hypothetical protein
MMKYTLLFIVQFIIGCMAWGDDTTSKTTNVRHLQTNQTLNYRATYKADFQHLRDFVCTADPPVLTVSCYGTAMTILSVSDPSIVCVPMDEPIISNGTSYQCTIQCTTTCNSVYEAAFEIADGPFASIEFICESDEIHQVNGLYTFESGNDGLCSTSFTSVSRNFHVARLGVLCSTESSRTYLYDDTFTECVFGNSTSPGFVSDIAVGLEDDLYTCIAGRNCQGTTCVVPFATISIYPTLPNLLSTCIESIAGTPEIPTSAPQASTSDINYVVQFEASWAQWFESLSSTETCASANPSVSISCGAGTSITYINSTDSSLLCNTPLGSNELICSGAANAIRNAFTSVSYVSIV